MYYEFFGLREAPFRITPNTDFFFGGGNRGPILEALIYAVTHGEGIIKVSGEVGSGKTMLCNMLMERLPEHIETVYLANPNVRPEEILHAIAFELQLGIERQAGRLEVMQALQEYLLQHHAEGKRVVLFVEESQGMPLETLEEIRLLSNLETKNDKLLQIVLFGQPELDENLRETRIRQLRERITHSFGLSPLTVNDIREYLMFRMRTAGYHGPDLFSERIVKMIARASGGLTRRINLIADKALLAAFSENTHTVKSSHVEAALRDSEFSHVAVKTGSTPPWAWLLAALAGVAIGAGGYAWYASQPAAPAPTPPKPAATSAPAAAAPTAPTPPTPAPIAPAPATAPEAAQPAATAPKPVEPVAPAEPPAPAAKPPAPATSATADILQERLDATVAWLSEIPDARWSLQTISTTSEEDLRNHLRFLSKSVEITKVFVYRHFQNSDQKGRDGKGGSPYYSVLFGSYADRSAAERAMADLPVQLKANNPLPIMIQNVRARLRSG
jgi:type II secretory pathway predicted ATPase ExeA/septal ring-binding cell division protein DamX